MYNNVRNLNQIDFQYNKMDHVYFQGYAHGEDISAVSYIIGFLFHFAVFTLKGNKY